MNPQVKHPQLFLDDGNIIILATSSNLNRFNVGNDVGANDGIQDLNGTVLFCAHKSVLARQSQVFGNMFNMAVGDAAETLEGHPTVFLPDPAEDVEALLNAIYNPSELPFKRHDPYTAVRVHQALHMATKYQCDLIRKRIVEHVKQDWPKDLTDFEYSEKDVRELMHRTTDNIDLVLPEPASSYRLGKLLDIPEILPASFYVLTTLKTDEDFDVHHGDLYKNRQLGNVNAEHPISAKDRTARWNLLDVHDFRALYRWREYINEFKLEWTYVEFEDDCLVSCEDVMEKIWDSYNVKLRETRDVLWILQNTDDVKRASAGKTLCEPCAHEMINQLHVLKLQFWEEITRLARPS